MFIRKSKQHKSNSYVSLKEVIDDVLYPAKLHFFSYFAYLLEPFLLHYQNDSPMVPFIHDDLFNLLSSLVQVIIRPEILEKCTTLFDLKKVDLGKKENVMKANHFSIGFATSQLIHDLKRRDSVSSSDILNFRRDIYKFVQVTVNKISDRFPVGSAIICNANVFNPTKMISAPSENLLIKARNLLKRLLNLKILTPTSCNKSLSEFNDFLRDDVKKYNDKFSCL